MTHDLEQLFAAGDNWLMKYGVVTPIMHNNIVLVLYAQFPQIKYLEYYINPEEESREIKLTVYLSTWRCLFSKKQKLIDAIFLTLEDYLFDYNIDIQIKRYTKATIKMKGGKHE